MRAASLLILLKRAGVAAGAVLTLLGSIEICIELFGNIPPARSPIAIWAQGNDQALMGGAAAALRPHHDWLWEPRPGGTYAGEKINDSGYRGPEVTKDKTQRFRILALGDSSTMGYGLPEAQAWPRQAEALLTSRGFDVEVANGGVIGFTAYQGARMFLGKWLDYNPDLVLASFGALNDQFTPDQGFTDADKHNIFSSPRARADAALGRFQIYRWLKSKIASEGGAAPAAKSQKDGAPRARVSIDEFKLSLASIDGAQSAAGRRTLLICPPRSMKAEDKHFKTLDYTNAIHELSTERSIPLADVYDLFRRHEETYLKPGESGGGESWYQDLVHPTAAGHRAYAELVATRVAEVVKNLPRVESRR